MPNETAYIGVWINYNKGSVLGATLTVSDRHGAILVAFLALLVGWAGGHFWNIACFVIHHIRSSRVRDGLDLQQQAILRTRLSDTATFARFVEMWWAWKSHTPAAFFRTTVLLAPAVLNIAFFTTAGIFSSKVAGTGTEVLARGMCGDLDTSFLSKDYSLWNERDKLAADGVFIASYNAFRSHSAYARSCYGSTLTMMTIGCNTYAKPFIPSHMDMNADCPFVNGTCSAPAVKIDSGKIDSSEYFGFNAPPRDRVQMRKTLTCAPTRFEELYATNWTKQVKDAADSFQPLRPVNDSLRYYYLGETALAVGGVSVPISNATFVVSNSSINMATQPYTLECRAAYPNNATAGSFIPRPELNRSNGDVNVFLLSNLATYTKEVNDPWFKASVQGQTQWGVPGTWTSARTLSGLGCVEQYQYCNPVNSVCTELGGHYQLSRDNPPDSLGFNAQQKAMFKRMHLHNEGMTTTSFLNFLNNEVLLANQFIYGSFFLSGPLEDNWWQQEMWNMFNISMAGLQSFALPMGNPMIRPGVMLEQFVIRDSSPEGRQICDHRLIRSSAHTSFSVLGLAFIVAGSCLIILVNLWLESFVIWYQKRFNIVSGRSAAWAADDVLVLQKTTLEAEGFGPWKKGASDVPVTEQYGMRMEKQFPYGNKSANTTLSVVWESFQKVDDGSIQRVPG